MAATVCVRRRGGEGGSPPALGEVSAAWVRAGRRTRFLGRGEGELQPELRFGPRVVFSPRSFLVRCPESPGLGVCGAHPERSGGSLQDGVVGSGGRFRLFLTRQNCLASCLLSALFLFAGAIRPKSELLPPLHSEQLLAP